jgi:RNA polymerase sigma-70 factor, ECF subfamily
VDAAIVRFLAAPPLPLIRGGATPNDAPQTGFPITLKSRIGTWKSTIMSWAEITILVDRAKTGDQDAFGELFVRFRQNVFVMAMAKMRNTAEAEELTQEVFVHAMRKLPQLRDARCFAGWLRRITARMAINRITRRGPAFGTEPEILDAIAGHEHDPADDLERSEAKAELFEALSALKPDDRATLEAFYIRHQSLKEMANEFDAPLGTIKRRLFVARNRLRDVLVNAGFGTEFELEEPVKNVRKRELVGV